jgi:hypothetical protein
MMANIEVKEFSGTSLLHVSALNSPTFGALVALSQNSGSLSFTFCMTPDQARHLASALMVQAAKADAATTPATTKEEA